MKRMLLLLSGLALLGSCENDTCSEPCGWPGAMHIGFVGFKAADLDTVMTVERWTINGKTDSNVNTFYTHFSNANADTLYDSAVDAHFDIQMLMSNSYSVSFMPVPTAATYTLNHFVTGGDLNGTMHCREGGTPSGVLSGCNTVPYISSYDFNSNRVVFAGQRNTGWIYIAK